MTTGTRRTLLLLATGLALMLGACSTSSTPAAASAPNGAATAPNGAATAPNDQSPTAGTAAAPSAAAPSAPAAGLGDACTLLTKAEVEAAFHETMLEPVSSVDNGDPTCTYMHSAGGLDLTVAISSQPSDTAGLKAAEAIYGGAATVVPGVGDAAFEAVGVLEFVKGTTLITLGTSDGPAIISDVNFRGLAATVAGRI